MKRQCIYRQPTEQGQIQVWQEGDRRSLWFDDVVLQSEIDLNDPAVLPNPVNRAMLAHLIFGQQPRQVLLAGCGGGAIARWFHARSPHTKGDAVELSAEVAHVAHEYFQFPDEHSLWRLRQNDVREFIRDQSGRYDFILVDLEEQQYSPQWVSGIEFLEYCYRALSDTGVLTINLIPDGPNHYAKALGNIRQVFQRRTISLPNEDHDNQLVIAFREPPSLSDIENQIRKAAARWGLPFARYWQRIAASNPSGSGVL